MKNATILVRVLTCIVACSLMTSFCHAKPDIRHVIDRGWDLLNKKNDNDANTAKYFFIRTAGMVPDTFYGGSHIFGLSAVYQQQKNPIAAYYYAKRALHAAQTYKDSVGAYLFLGRTCNRSYDAYGAIQYIERALTILQQKNDTVFIKEYNIEREYKSYIKYLAKYSRGNIIIRVKHRLYSFGYKTAAMVPVLYPLLGGKIIYSYLVLFVLSILFGLMLLNARLKGRANLRRTKLYVTYYIYIAGYFIISIFTQLSIHYCFVLARNTDYFSYPLEGVLLYRVSEIAYLLFFLTFDKYNHWLVIKSIVTGFRRKKILVQLSWGVFAYVIMLIAQGLLPMLKKQLFPPGIAGPYELITRYCTVDTVLLGPFIEEVLFRWLLYRLARTMTNRWLAIGISYIVFALIHFRFHEISLTKMILYAGITIATVITLERTKSVFPPFIVHSLSNLLAVVTHKV